MALKTIPSSDLCSAEVSYQIATDASDRDLITSLIRFLQKHHLNETQAAFLQELSLIEKAQVTLEELEQAIFKRDFKISKDSQILHNGNFFPLPMETEESNKKIQIAYPETFIFQTSEKPGISDSSEISLPFPMHNCLNTRRSSAQDPVLVSKVELPASLSESDTAPSSTVTSVPCQSPLSSAANFQVPIILNSLAASNQASNVVTLLQTNQSIPSSTSQQILLDVGTNSIGHMQQLGASGLNGVIPIQLNLSSAQPVHQPQQQPQVVFNAQQLQLINSGSKHPVYRPAQTQIPVPIILSHNGDTPSNLASITCPPKIVSRMVETTTNGHNGTPPLNIQVQYQQPISTLTKAPIATPVIQQTGLEQDPQLVQKEGAQITLASNSHPILSYSQFPPPISHTPKTVITSNGICQVENLQLTPNAWLKESSADIHTIPIINTTLGPHFGLDSSFELGQRRRKKRAVFAPQARRALEQSFEQNSRPSRRELEYLAGKLGLLFEEVRVWFCNKRQKERQQMQLTESQCDTPSDSYNSLDCTSPTTFQPSQTMEEEPVKILEFQIKEECESPGNFVSVPGVSDSSHPFPKEILMPDSYEIEYKTCSSESSISAFVQGSIA